MDKRSFLKGLAMTGLSAPLSAYSMGNWTDRFNKIPAPSITGNDVWTDIRNGYKLKPDYINLENGYYNFLPEEILENFIRHVREVYYQGSYYMLTVQFDNKKNIAASRCFTFVIE